MFLNVNSDRKQNMSIFDKQKKIRTDKLVLIHLYIFISSGCFFLLYSLEKIFFCMKKKQTKEGAIRQRRKEQPSDFFLHPQANEFLLNEYKCSI